MNMLTVLFSSIAIVTTGVATVRLIRTQRRAVRLARGYDELNPFGHAASWDQIEAAPQYIRSSLTLQAGRRWEWGLLVLGLIAQSAALLT